MRELRPDSARLDMIGPGHDHAVACSTKVRGDLLHPWEGSIGRPGPADRKMTVTVLAAQFVDHAVEPGHVLSCAVGECAQLIGAARHSAFG